MPRTKARRVVRRVGDRFATMSEWYNGKAIIWIHEVTQDEQGRQWNTLVGDVICEDINQAQEFIKWIR